MSSKSLTCNCGNTIPFERAELGYRNCLRCGEKIAASKRPAGYVSYGHKTAGAIVITSKAGYDNYRKVSARMNKGSNMGYASRMTTQF
jgi:hypothetical protein